MLLIIGALAFFGGMIWEHFRMKRVWSLAFEKFRDEMHKQYFMLLEHHGIKLNKEGRAALRKNSEHK